MTSAIAAGALAAAAKPIPLIAPGPYAVGSSNFEVVEPQVPIIDYLKGRAGEGETQYVGDLLKHPAAALQFVADMPQVPADAPPPFHAYAGRKLPFAMYVLYPTTADNPRPDYRFPYAETADNLFPHMQRAGEKPLPAQASARYPLILFSHGYEGHGLWDLDHLKFLAAQGYVVASVFYGDGRGPGEANFGMRPLVLGKALDYLLGHPDFAPMIDAARIGVSGSSFGGYTILTAMGGARVDLIPSLPDPRIQAGFATVPYVEHQGFAYFGKSQAGLQKVTRPFLAVYGEADTVSLPGSVEAGVRQLGGDSVAVALEGEEHILSPRAWPVVYTWETLFFNAWLRGDATAKQQLYGGDSVAGEVANRKTWQRVDGKVTKG
ncbi:hypothetical protein [Niveibacterium sp. SC-1]|uniref:alpha/beta hydrolase family protein n=1 Tax=Niveibacterium sp. SC-1 TaxID=3135646 RepID=UPI00311ED1E5